MKLMERGYLRAERSVEELNFPEASSENLIRIVKDRNQAFEFLTTWFDCNTKEFWNWLRFGEKGSTFINKCTDGTHRVSEWIMLDN